MTVQAHGEGCQVRVHIYGPDDALVARSSRSLDHATVSYRVRLVQGT